MKAEHQRIEVLELWCLRRLLRVPWTARSNQSILKEVDTEYPFGRTDTEAEAPILWLPDEKSQLIRKDTEVGKDWRQEQKGRAEDEMVGWHHQLNGHEFEQALGDGEGQGSLACYNPWGHKSWAWLSNWTTTWPLSQCYHPIVPFYCPLLSPSILHCSLILLPSIFPNISIFSSEVPLRMKRPKYWSFTFSISPFSEYSELISFRIDWFDLLAIQGTLKSLLQHHNWRVYFDKGSRNMASLSRDNWPLWGATFRGCIYLRYSPRALMSWIKWESTEMEDENS